MTCCSIVGHLNILQFRLRDQNSFSTKPVVWHRVLTFWRLPYFHGFWHGCWWKLSKQNSMGNTSMEQDLYWLIACNMFYTCFLGHLLFFSLVYLRVLPPWRTSNDSFLFFRKVSTEKKKEGDLENSHRSGSENLGYIPEELWNTEQNPSESELVNHRL